MKKDEIIIDWLKNRRATRNTEIAYLQAMQFYTEYTGQTPAELLEEAEAEIEARVLLRKQKIRSKIIGFREYVEARESAPMTVKNRMSAITSFYKSNSIILPELPRSDRRTQPKKSTLQFQLKKTFAKSFRSVIHFNALSC